jgi:hypothetical protein
MLVGLAPSATVYSFRGLEIEWQAGYSGEGRGEGMFQFLNILTEELDDQQCL